MKLLDKFTLILFSIIILMLSVIVTFLMFGVLSVAMITNFYGSFIADQTNVNITIGVSILCAILALRALFFGASPSSAVKEGVLLENESGRLFISKDTIENLVNGVAKSFENTQSVSTKVVIDENNELKVYATLVVLPSTVINELSVNLQTKIKEVVKSVTNLDVKSIDIKIRDITTPESKKEG